MEMKSGSRGYSMVRWVAVISMSLAVVSNLRWYKWPNSTNVDEEPKVHNQVNLYYGRYGLKGLF